MRKIILYNLLNLTIIIIFLFIFIELINFLISGQPRYWEVVHNRNHQNVKVNNEKIVQLKKNINNKINFLDIRGEKYKNLGYSGKIINGKCGSIENGFNELIYQTDKFGFRENIDLRYKFSDFVLLGDSFTESICENKPNDLKSNLLMQTNFTYLNLGMHGTDYPAQALNLIEYTKDTNFNGLLWFFYEGNDYEKKSYELEEIPQRQGSEFNINKNEIYELNINHNISIFFKFKVWLSEFLRGPSVLIKFFKNYNSLLDKKDYNQVLANVSKYLKKNNVEKKYIIYIPSWQKISLYKLHKLKIYNKHPQVIQLNNLKNNVKKIAKKNNFQFIDIENYFFELNDPMKVYHYRLNTHFNSYGNKILSKAIIKKLQIIN